MMTPAHARCLRCGGRRFVQHVNPAGCARCHRTKFRFRRVIAFGEYEKDLRLHVLRMKTEPSGLLARNMGGALAIHRKEDLRQSGADWIVPVPMSRWRLRQRGVNSPDFIAEELGYRLKIPVAKNAVCRVRETSLQYTLSVRSRAENVAGAFALCPPPFYCFNKSRYASALTGKKILLVDDIFTTGATCSEITKVLLRGGARSVTVAVLARAEGQFDPHREP